MFEDQCLLLMCELLVVIEGNRSLARVIAYAMKCSQCKEVTLGGKEDNLAGQN